MRALQENYCSMACLALLLFISHMVSGSFPTAQNVSWDSVNFKTFLTWKPKPTNYSYTVEFSKQGEDRKKTPLCIQSSETDCDLTAELQDLRGSYTADILSEPVRGSDSDIIEHPSTQSSPFCPYKDTVIGGPNFTIDVGKDKRTMTLNISTIITAVFDAQKRRLTIQDIFKDDLHYKVEYRKAQSSGKTEKMSPSSIIEITGLDRGVSYCFTVQVYIPSRNFDKRLGKPSQVQCSPKEDISFIEEFSLTVIAVIIVVIIGLVVVGITAVVLICRRKQRNQRNIAVASHAKNHSSSALSQESLY